MQDRARTIGPARIRKGSVRGVPIIENIGYNLEDDPGASCSFDFGLQNHSTVGRNPGSP